MDYLGFVLGGIVVVATLLLLGIPLGLLCEWTKRTTQETPPKPQRVFFWCLVAASVVFIVIATVAGQKEPLCLAIVSAVTAAAEAGWAWLTGSKEAK